jgi:hypothetical protein
MQLTPEYTPRAAPSNLSSISMLRTYGANTHTQAPAMDSSEHETVWGLWQQHMVVVVVTSVDRVVVVVVVSVDRVVVVMVVVY